MATPEKIISQLTGSHSSWQLLYEMSTKQFFKLQWPFTAKHSNEDWFIFKLEQPTSVNITVDKEPIDLFYGRLFTLKEKDKNIGFMVNTPSMQHQPYYDTLISAPKKTRIEDLDDNADVYLTTPDFSVFVLDDTIQYISAYSREIQSKFT